MMLVLLRIAAAQGAGSNIPAEFGESVTETMRTILAEPNYAARRSLVYGYFEQLPGTDSPQRWKRSGVSKDGRYQRILST